MYKPLFIAQFFVLSFFWTSCSDDDGGTPVAAALKSSTAKNIPAPQSGGVPSPASGSFTRFSFAKGEVVVDGSWDIAFRGTTILVNGGAVIGINDEPSRTGVGAVSIQTGSLASITEVPTASSFKQDGIQTYAIPTGSGNGWYTYNPTVSLISPIAGKIFVVKTHDGKFAKFEIISYYKDAPTSPDPMVGARYYTFNYVYQPSGIKF